MDIFETRDKRYGICVRWSGEASSGKKLPCLFFGKPKSLPPIVGTLSKTTAKKYVLGLQYPVTSANDKYLSLLRAISELIGAVTSQRYFSTVDHILALREERRDEKNMG